MFWFIINIQQVCFFNCFWFTFNHLWYLVGSMWFFLHPYVVCYFILFFIVQLVCMKYYLGGHWLNPFRMWVLWLLYFCNSTMISNSSYFSIRQWELNFLISVPIHDFTFLLGGLSCSHVSITTHYLDFIQITMTERVSLLINDNHINYDWNQFSQLKISQ